MNFGSFVKAVGFFSVTSLFAAQVNFECENGQFNIKGYNLKQSQRSWQINVYVNGQFLDDINSNSGNAFSYSLDASDYQGDSVKVQINNYDGSGDHRVFTKTVNCSSGGNSGGNAGGHNGGSGGSHGGGTSIPVDPSMSDSEIREYANQQARTVANKVVKIYGKLEAYKRSFVRGFWLGYDLYQSNPWKYRESEMGQQDGQTQGRLRGRNVGRNNANAKALSMAAQDSKARFVSIVDTGRSPDTSLQVPHVNYAGADAGLNSVNMDPVWNDLDSQLQRELRNLSLRDGDYYLTYDFWTGKYRFTIKDVYTYGGSDKYSLVDSWFRADHAWDEWRYNRLGGRYDFNKYNDMSYSEQQRFESAFRSIYNSVIDEKMYEVRNMSDEGAYGRGVYYGHQAGQKLAYNSGYNRGYNEGYRNSSRDEFYATFDNSYRSEFNSKLDYYNGNPVVEVIGARMIDGNGNSVYELGEEVGVEISRIVNIGRQPLVLSSPSLSGGSLDSTRADVAAITVEPSSSLKAPVRLDNLAKVKFSAPSNQNLDAIVRFSNGVSTNVNFKVSFDDVLQVFGNSSPADAKLRSYIVLELKKEFDQAMSSESSSFPKLIQVISAKSRASNPGNFSGIGTELANYASVADVGGWGSKKKDVKKAFDAQVAKLK